MSALVAAAELVAAIRDRLERAAIAGIRYDYPTGEALIILQWALGEAEGVNAERMLRGATSCLIATPVNAPAFALHQAWVRVMDPTGSLGGQEPFADWFDESRLRATA